MSKTTLSLIVAVVYFLISIVLLTLPGTAFPEEDWLDKIWFDKWVHIGMFGLMVILWCLYFWLAQRNKTTNSTRTFWIVAISALGYGIIMEFIQQNFIPLRSFDFGDIVADTIGCSVGLIFSLRRYIKK